MKVDKKSVLFDVPTFTVIIGWLVPNEFWYSSNMFDFIFLFSSRWFDGSEIFRGWGDSKVEPWLVSNCLLAVRKRLFVTGIDFHNLGGASITNLGLNFFLGVKSKTTMFSVYGY